jgi:TRAP transporter 4TM/12TM fusion protein
VAEEKLLSAGDKARLLEVVEEKESGGRKLTGPVGAIAVNVAVVWSLFQLWIASPLPYSLGWGVINSTGQRSIHLAAAFFLVFMLYPRGKSSPRGHVPAYDWLFAIVAASCAAYIYVFAAELGTRPGSPTRIDLAVTVIGVMLLLEATRRCLGWPMTVMAIIFIVYMFAGPYMPDMISHKGASLGRAASQTWLTTEGVFGIALGVSAEFVFLYVLFGALLDQAGAGNWMTRVAFALMGHLRGGPAKASVLSSGLNGMISGSSVANVLTGGNVTIMLMKRVGYSPVKAGAIEVASSSNGQIMPPVMGAAAFLMVEYVNMPYTEIVKHAFLPAILAYVSLMWIVHLEAVKLGMKGLERAPSSFRDKLFNWIFAIAGFTIVIQLAFWLTAWIPGVFGEQVGSLVVGALVFAAYVAGVRVSARYPDASGVITEALEQMPATRPTVLGGLFYILPIFVLVWCLMVLDQSAGLAAFYACTVMIAMLLTQRPLIAWFRKLDAAGAWKHGAKDLHLSLQLGARNMLGIAIATATAGIIVGSAGFADAGTHPHCRVFPGARHGAADDGQLHRRVDAAGAGDREARRLARPGGAADRGAPVRLLLRNHGRRHAASGARGLRRRRALGRRPAEDRRAGVHLRAAHGDPAVHVRLQHRAPDDQHRRADAFHLGGVFRHGGLHGLRLRDPGLDGAEEPLVRVGAAGRRHAGTAAPRPDPRPLHAALRAATTCEDRGGAEDREARREHPAARRGGRQEGPGAGAHVPPADGEGLAARTGAQDRRRRDRGKGRQDRHRRHRLRQRGGEGRPRRRRLEPRARGRDEAAPGRQGMVHLARLDADPPGVRAAVAAPARERNPSRDQGRVR